MKPGVNGNMFLKIVENITVVRDWPCRISTTDGFLFTLAISKSPFAVHVKQAGDVVTFPAGGIPERVWLLAVKRWMVENRAIEFNYLDNPAPKEVIMPDSMVVPEMFLGQRGVANAPVDSIRVKSWVPRMKLKSGIWPQFKQVVNTVLKPIKVRSTRITTYNQLTLKSIPNVSPRSTKSEQTKDD